MPAGAEMEVARANRAVPPRIILDLSSICYTDRLGAGFGHGGANPNAKEKGLCTSAYHHHYIDLAWAEEIRRSSTDGPQTRHTTPR